MLTVDLFLDLVPFSLKKENVWGTNVDVHRLVEWSGLDLVQGDRAELFGFSEFEPQAVLGNLNHYMIAVGYPVVAQSLVLRKGAG